MSNFDPGQHSGGSHQCADSATMTRRRVAGSRTLTASMAFALSLLILRPISGRLATALVVVAVVLAVTSSPALASSPSAAGSSAVTPWIDLELEVIASQRVNPPRASRALALVSRGMFEAASEAGPSQDAAVAGAAATILAHLFPDEQGRIHGLAQRSLAEAQTRDDSGRGFALGRRIGEKLIVRAKSDGSNSTESATAPVGPGFWVPTPPGFDSPLEPRAGSWRPWNLSSGAQFRPSGPPVYDSPQFQAEVREVYGVSQTLTDEQKRIAEYWADGPGTFTPPGHWNAIAIALVHQADWSTLETARLLSALNTAQADAFIACWDAKFAYWSLRPVTAIREQISPDWLPYLRTPPFPGYVSGHATTSGAASTVLAEFFPAKRSHLNAMAQEAAVSRLYGGIHIPSDNDDGLVLGRRVGAAALSNYR